MATVLSGRYVEFYVFPYSYEEFLELTSSEKNKKSFIEYMNSGGLPQIFQLLDDESKRHYISSLKDTILLRDIIQRYGIKDARLLEDIFIFLINNASNLISINSIINYFKSKNRKTNYETLSNYIDYLRNTMLIHKVDRYHIKRKETISGNHKYYLNDLAFKNFLFPGYEYGIGYMLENIVLLQLLSKGYIVYTGVVSNREIDFVAIKSNRTIYVQVAYLLAEENTIQREYGELEKIPDNYDKFVVTMDDVQYPDRNGIKHCQAWNIGEIF